MAGVLVRGLPRSVRPAYPFGSVLPARGELEDLFSRFWGGEGNGSLMQGLATSMDVAETDKLISKKIENGLNIRVVRLNPTEVQVKDLPRLVIFPSGSVIRGESNVKVYLAGLIK